MVWSVSRSVTRLCIDMFMSLGKVTMLNKMKFSYRVTTVTLLLTTMVVMYLSWGDDYMMWNRKPVGGKSGNVTMTFSTSGRHDDSRNGQCSGEWWHQGSQTTLDTHDILYKINEELRPGFDREKLHQEGQPIPDDKIDPTYKKLPLKIFLIPHSHSDPGWQKTVYGYFQDQTRPTLDNMVNKLLKYPNMTFIWAESVFLHMWYQDSAPQMQQDVQMLIKRGQLEIVVGTWVVPDEANPHYFALVDQMIEGHQWLESKLGVKPENTWSLDPFGYSATLPYLYQRAGYKNMVILRVHERVKAIMEQDMGLEFYWRQGWDQHHDTDIFSQLMPYRLYNIKHTCGPDQQVCLNFDFRKIPGEGSEAHSRSVTPDNVELQAKMLIEQYHKKATLFKHNVLLVPLGDDFRYDREIEWDQQYENYQKLFDYINSRTDWNVQARFGTLKDYFEEVRRTSADIGTPMEKMFPSLTGDFYPYTDQRDEYWSGYFTSRPYDKVMGRELEVWLRGAEILHTLVAATHMDSYVEYMGNTQLLEMSRRSLGLFQHHDAITGTARHYVTSDYDLRLQKGLEHTHDVIKAAAKYLLSNKAPSDKDLTIIDVDNPISQRMLEPHLKKYNVPDKGQRIGVYNSVAQHREELITLTVSNPAVVVYVGRQFLHCQVNPLWLSSTRTSTGEYQLVFRLHLPPLGIVVVSLLPAHTAPSHKCHPASIFLYNTKKLHIPTKSLPFHIVKGGREPVVLENSALRVAFSAKTGFIQSITSKSDQKKLAADLQFLTYRSMRSGAYIFKPEGPADTEELVEAPLYRLIRGPLVSEVQVIQEVVNHTVRLHNTTGLLAQAVQIDNIVDMTKMDNNELIMRVNTSVANTDGHFYTDLNAFQVMKRKRFKNFPIEANYYPSTTFVYLEDEEMRVTLVSSQSLGASSQGDGSLEVMLDRRLRYDDGRGLGEGVQDNKPTTSRFYLLVEDLSGVSPTIRKMHKARHFSLPSLEAHTLADWLRHYPLSISLGSGASRDRYEPMNVSLPCDVTLVNLRSLTSAQRALGSIETALVLHRVGYDCEITHQHTSHICTGSSPDGAIILQQLFNETIKIPSAKESTLSLMHDKRKVDLSQPEILKPMHLYSYRLLLG